LYRNLYNIEFYLEAYAKLYPNKGSNTKGVNNCFLQAKNT
jgi:hypothetical protein